MQKQLNHVGLVGFWSKFNNRPGLRQNEGTGCRPSEFAETMFNFFNAIELSLEVILQIRSCFESQVTMVNDVQ